MGSITSGIILWSHGSCEVFVGGISCLFVTKKLQSDPCYLEIFPYLKKLAMVIEVVIHVMGTCVIYSKSADY